MLHLKHNILLYKALSQDRAFLLNKDMSNVNQYVNVMRATGTKTNNSPNSESSQLKNELIEHYKLNKAKAEQLIKSVEVNDEQATHSPTHRLHYEAAVIAIRGYQQPNTTVPPNKIGAPTDVFGAPKVASRESELLNLKKAGWVPFTR